MILSPSSINLYRTSPALWVIKHFFGHRSASGEAALRGKRVEDAINSVLVDGLEPLVAATELARVGEEDHDAQELSNYFSAALEELKKHGELVSSQKQVFLSVGGVEVGGFIDYEFADYCIDLKTTTRLPVPLTSKSKAGMLPAAKLPNIIQQAFYAEATGKPQKLLYVDPTGASYLHDVLPQEVEKGMEALRETVAEIDKLTQMEWDDLFKATVPDLDRLYNHPFVDQETYNIIAETYETYI